MTWAAVEAALPEAKAIAFDGCHKVYLAMDNEQVWEFTGYPYVVTVDDPVESLATLHEWWDESCFLRFISAVRSVGPDEDPNKGFTSLIRQFEDEEDSNGSSA